MKTRGAITCTPAWVPSLTDADYYAMTYSGCDPGTSVLYRGDWQGGCTSPDLCEDGGFGGPPPLSLEYIYFPSALYDTAANQWYATGVVPGYATAYTVSSGIAAPVQDFSDDASSAVGAVGLALTGIFVAVVVFPFLTRWLGRVFRASTGSGS